MAIIHQYDKRSGITYAYESHSYWDKEKKMTRAKRTLIGRVDTATGEIVPTDGRCRKDKPPKAAAKPDYKKLYEQLQKRCESLEVLVAALQKETSRTSDKE
jgi:hypothetical protein